MECPNCNATVDDDRAICPECDHILDASAFDNEPRPSKAPSGVKKAPLKKKKKVIAAAKPKPAPVEDDDTPPPTKKKKDDHADWRSRVAKEDLEEANAPSKAPKFVADRGLRSEDLVNETQGFLKSLSTSDKIALYGSIGMAFSVFMPWKQTAEQGAVVGIFSSGVLVLILSAVAIAAIYARVQKVGGAEGTLRPLLAQFAGIAFGITWTILFTILAIDSTLVMGPLSFEKVWASKPAIGVVLSLAGGGVALFGTITGLKENQNR